MLRTRKFWLLALTLGVATLAAPVRAAEIDKLTPADAQVVVVFNVRQAIDSPLAKKKGVTDLLKAGIEGNKEAKQAMTALGLDVTKDIERVSVSVGGPIDFQGGKKPDKVLIAIHGNFDPDRIEATAKKVDAIKVSKEGTATIYEIQDKGETNYATVIGKNTIAASPSKEYLLLAVKNVGGGSKELSKASAKVDGKQSMWMAVVITDDMRKAMAQSPQMKDVAGKIESITMGIHVTDEIVLDLNINTADGAAAKAMKTQVDAALPFITAIIGDDNPASGVVKDLMKTLKITAKEDALNLNMSISEATLDKIIKLVGMNKLK